jgi:hypothetical protein
LHELKNTAFIWKLTYSADKYISPYGTTRFIIWASSIPAHIFKIYLLGIYLNIILSPACGSLKPNFMCISCITHMMHILLPKICYFSNNTRSDVQVAKLPVRQFSPISNYSTCLRTIWCFFLKYPQFILSL